MVRRNERVGGNRTLTFDESRAAEAAFRGLPIDPGWSLGAQSIYLGILAQTQGRNIVEESPLETAVLQTGDQPADDTSSRRLSRPSSLTRIPDITE